MSIGADDEPSTVGFGKKKKFPLIAIAGSGVTGLSCAIALLDAGLTPILIDARQELGTPVRRPGWIKDIGKWKPWLEEHNLSHMAQLQEWENNQGGLRREWLEKSLAIHVVRRGAMMLIKTRLLSAVWDDSLQKWSLGVVGAGPHGTSTQLVDMVVDACGVQPPCGGWPGDPTILDEHATNPNLVKFEVPKTMEGWRGGVTISDLLPPKWCSTPGWNPATRQLLVVRRDGTSECWESHTLENEEETLPPFLEPAPSCGWLEVMRGVHPSPAESVCVDYSLEGGIELSQEVLKRLRTSGTLQ